MRAEELLETLTDDQLRERANECLSKAEPLFTGLLNIGTTEERHRLLTEADFYLKALQWRHDDRIARRDFLMEVGVIVLIGMEIMLSVYGLWEGSQQGKLIEKQTAALAHMDTSTTATADSLQKLVAAQDASLRILQQQEAEHSRKPRFVLYVGDLPLGKRPILLAYPVSEVGYGRASFDLTIKNVGDLPASEFKLHVIAPEYANMNLPPLPPLPEYEQSAPGSRGLTWAVPLMPVGKSIRIQGEVFAQRGKPPFKAIFTITSPQLASVMRVGSLVVVSPKGN